MFRIGVISDTHNFLDPKILELFADVDHILHAGDIGQPRLILELEQIAPVTAVLGNTDDSGIHYRLTEIVELADRKFLIHHIVDPHAPDETLQRLLDREKPAVVVFGHTHKQFSETIRSILFFNPGYAGKSRFGMPRSVAILHINGKGIRCEFLSLRGTISP
jgi:putative phosphoesterase